MCLLKEIEAERCDATYQVINMVQNLTDDLALSTGTEQAFGTVRLPGEVRHGSRNRSQSGSSGLFSLERKRVVRSPSVCGVSERIPSVFVPAPRTAETLSA